MGAGENREGGLTWARGIWSSWAAGRSVAEAALGHEIHPRNDIPINAGRQKAPWIGNCIAIGLSSSFLEPLEATSIHGTIVQLLMLAEWLDDPQGRDRYKAAVARQVDDFRDFIRFHYVTERRDSAFWQDVAGSHPDFVHERLALWQTRLPQPQDFAPFPLGLPHLQGQLYVPVLDGLGHLNQAAARAVMAANPALRDKTRATHAALVAEYARAADACLPHRAWLQSLAGAAALP
jgi:tryptophan halogenase